MKEKILNFGITAGALISLFMGVFYVVFSAFVELPILMSGYSGVAAKIFVAFENFAHTVAFYAIIALLGAVSLINRFSKKQASKFKNFLLYAIIFFCFVGIIGVLVNAFMDISGQSQNNMFFGTAATVLGYVMRFEFILCFIVFILCAILSYRAIKIAPISRSMFLILLLCLALYNVASIAFISVYGNGTSSAVYVHTALALFYRPLAAYGTFSVKK